MSLHRIKRTAIARFGNQVTRTGCWCQWFRNQQRWAISTRRCHTYGCEFSQFWGRCHGIAISAHSPSCLGNSN